MNVTVPLAPCVTEVTARPAFSKLSALAPSAPVIALKLIAVSSLVDHRVVDDVGHRA